VLPPPRGAAAAAFEEFDTPLDAIVSVGALEVVMSAF